MNAHIDVIAVFDRMINQISTSTSPHAVRECTEAAAAVGELILAAQAALPVAAAMGLSFPRLKVAAERCGVAP